MSALQYGPGILPNTVIAGRSSTGTTGLAFKAEVYNGAVAEATSLDVARLTVVGNQ